MYLNFHSVLILLLFSICIVNCQLVDQFLSNIGSIIGIPLTPQTNKIPVENRLVLNYQLNELQNRVKQVEGIQALRQRLAATATNAPRFQSLPLGNAPAGEYPRQGSFRQERNQNAALNNHLGNWNRNSEPSESFILSRPATSVDDGNAIAGNLVQFRRPIDQFLPDNVVTGAETATTFNPLDVVQEQLLETGGQKWLSFLAGDQVPAGFTSLPPPTFNLLGPAPPSPRVSWNLASLPSTSANIANVNDFLGLNSQFSAISDLTRQISNTIPQLPKAPYSPRRTRYPSLPKVPNLLPDLRPLNLLQNNPPHNPANLISKARQSARKIRESRERNRIWRSREEIDFEKEVKQTLKQNEDVTARIILENSRNGHVLHKGFTKVKNDDYPDFQTAFEDSDSKPAGELIARRRPLLDDFAVDTDDYYYTSTGKGQLASSGSKFRGSSYPDSKIIVEREHIFELPELAGELVAHDRHDDDNDDDNYAQEDPLHEFLEVATGSWDKKYNQPLLGKQWRYSGPSRISGEETPQYPIKRRPSSNYLRNARQNNRRRIGLFSRNVVNDLVNYFTKG